MRRIIVRSYRYAYASFQIPVQWCEFMLGSARAAIQPCNYFRSIPTYVITVPERYRETDGRTEIAKS